MTSSPICRLLVEPLCSKNIVGTSLSRSPKASACPSWSCWHQQEHLQCMTFLTVCFWRFWTSLRWQSLIACWHLFPTVSPRFSQAEGTDTFTSTLLAFPGSTTSQGFESSHLNPSFGLYSRVPWTQLTRALIHSCYQDCRTKQPSGKTCIFFQFFCVREKKLALCADIVGVNQSGLSR